MMKSSITTVLLFKLSFNCLVAFEEEQNNDILTVLESAAALLEKKFPKYILYTLLINSRKSWFFKESVLLCVFCFLC